MLLLGEQFVTMLTLRWVRGGGWVGLMAAGCRGVNDYWWLVVVGVRNTDATAIVLEKWLFLSLAREDVKSIQTNSSKIIKQITGYCSGVYYVRISNGETYIWSYTAILTRVYASVMESKVRLHNLYWWKMRILARPIYIYNMWGDILLDRYEIGQNV